jgi:hypothetical protein
MPFGGYPSEAHGWAEPGRAELDASLRKAFMKTLPQNAAVARTVRPQCGKAPALWEGWSLARSAEAGSPEVSAGSSIS